MYADLSYFLSYLLTYFLSFFLSFFFQKLYTLRTEREMCFGKSVIVAIPEKHCCQLLKICNHLSAMDIFGD
jgi:hypothetical protein